MNWFEKLSAKHPKKTRFYHASPHRFPVGTMLYPGKDLPTIKPQYEFAKDFLFLTTDPKPHFTIAGDMKETWHVYEVLPEGELWPGENRDIKAERAKVVRYVGTANGMYQREKIKQRKKFEEHKEHEGGAPFSLFIPGTSSVDYRKVVQRGPYKVKGKHLLVDPHLDRRRMMQQDKEREDFVRRMHEVGVERHPGEPAWFMKVIEFLATDKAESAINEVLGNLRNEKGWASLSSARELLKKLAPRAEELRRKMEAPTS